MTQASWGIVSTIKAPTLEVLKFAAYHLEHGADHLFIYLDDCNEDTATALNAHPKVTAILTDDGYWSDLMGRRPGKHQQRQSRNATHCYHTLCKQDWLVHIDVDEFLCSDRPVAEILSQQDNETKVIRVAPFESLCVEDGTEVDPATVLCKSRLPAGAKGQRLAQEIYPNFGGFFKSAFISHTAGKIFVRAGLDDTSIRIHRAFDGQKQPYPDVTTSEIELCHCHVQSWEKWLKIMAFRLKKGSYRAELEQSLDPASGRVSRHNLFTTLTEDGTNELRAFFEEICLATPTLVNALEQNGLLRRYELQLEGCLAKQFAEF